MKISICFLIALLGFVSFSAFAECGTTTCEGKISKIYFPPSSPQKIWIGTDGDESFLNCSAVSGVYVTLEASHINFAEIYAALLAAQHSNLTVTVRIDEGTTGCSILYIVSGS